MPPTFFVPWVIEKLQNFILCQIDTNMHCLTLTKSPLATYDKCPFDGNFTEKCRKRQHELFHGKREAKPDFILFSHPKWEIFDTFGTKILFACASCVQGPPAIAPAVAHASLRHHDDQHKWQSPQKKGAEIYFSIFFMHSLGFGIWVDKMQSLAHTPPTLMTRWDMTELMQPITQRPKPFSHLFLDFGEVHRPLTFLEKNKSHKIQEKMMNFFLQKIGHLVMDIRSTKRLAQLLPPYLFGRLGPKDAKETNFGRF